MKHRLVASHVALATLLLLCTCSASLAAAKPGLDRAPSLLTRLQEGIDESNHSLEQLLDRLQSRRNGTAHQPDIELLAHLKETPGIRPELLAMIERYQNSGQLEEGRASSTTIARLFDQLKGQLAKEHRERLTQLALDRVAEQRRAASQRQAMGAANEPLLPLAL